MVMSSESRFLRTLSGCLMVAVLAGLPGLPAAQEYFETYGLVADSPSLDLGNQPLAYPAGVVGAVLRRDRILKSELERLATPLATAQFRGGTEMVGLLEAAKLDAAILGDMPTLSAAVRADVWIAGLVKQSLTAVVARGENQIRNLRGKRVGYVAASSAHHTLLQALASADLTERDVTLVPISIDAMPDELARGSLDAFAGWEPAPSIALARSRQHRTVFRGLSSTYLVIRRGFEQKHPEAARALVAALVRAVEWMRLGSANTTQAARWAMADEAAFTGKPARVTVEQAIAITRRELLNIPSAPTIAHSPGNMLLKTEFEFLKGQGKLAGTVPWQKVADAFAYEGPRQVFREPVRYRTRQVDYDGSTAP